MRRRWTAALTALLLLVLNTAVTACPMCKDSVPNEEGSTATPTMGGPGDPSGMSGRGMSGGGLPGGFNTSVYLMLIGLFCCLGLVGWTIVKAVRTTPTHARGFPVVQSGAGTGGVKAPRA